MSKNAPYMGFEKDAPSANGPKMGGKSPVVHSHSGRPHRKVMARKRSGKQLFK